MIEGRLVRLRALSAEDLDAHFRWRNDPEVVHWATGDNPYFGPVSREAMATFHIGLVPLDDSPFERAKFPFKLLQYLALGLPAVSSRVGVATTLLDPEQLAGSPDEWHAALGQLIADAALRRRRGDAGRQVVDASYTLERVGPLLVDGLLSAAR